MLLYVELTTWHGLRMRWESKWIYLGAMWDRCGVVLYERYTGIQQSSTVFPDFCRFAMVCFSFRTFGLVRICFWSACRQLLESVNIDKFFPFVADIVFRARWFACVSSVNMEQSFGSDADSVRFPVVAAAPTPISLLEPSVYMCFNPLYLFSTTFINLLWYLRLSWCLIFRGSARDRFIQLLGSPQVGSLISNREYEKCGRLLYFLSSILCVFFWFWLRTEGGNFRLLITFLVLRWRIWKLDFVVSFSLCSSILGSVYLFLSGAEVLLW